MDTYMARVAENRRIALDLHELALELPEEAFAGAAPGQCAHVGVPGGGEMLLRRPISIYSTRGGVLRLAIQPKGEGTARIVAARPGDVLDVLFPFGKGFCADGARVIWLVGGGVGVAPMRGCAEGFSAAKRAYFGYRSRENVYAADECREAGLDVVVCTDDGSAGEHGLVNAPLDRDLGGAKPDLLMACGPAPMLRAVRDVARKHGVPLKLSLEQRMGCGIGACLVCSCAAQAGGYLRVCADGPVFDGKEVRL